MRASRLLHMPLNRAVASLMWMRLQDLAVLLSLGLLCARFRDIPQIVSSLVQVFFFLSPVMPDEIPDETGNKEGG